METALALSMPSALAGERDTLAELLGEYLAENMNEGTRRRYGCALSALSEGLELRTVADLLAVTPGDVRRYRDERLQTAARGTVAQELGVLHGLFRFLAERGADVRSPVTRKCRREVSPPTESPRLGLDRVAVRALLGAVEGDDLRALRDRALLTVALYHGLRRAELVSLTLESFDVRDGVRVLRVTGKGGKVRTSAVLPSTWEAVRAYLVADGRFETPGPVFQDVRGGKKAEARRGRPITGETVRNVVAKYSVRADGAKVGATSPHVLRHTFCTALLARGVELPRVQSAMGHASPTTTMRYARALTEATQSATLEVAY